MKTLDDGENTRQIVKIRWPNTAIIMTRLRPILSDKSPQIGAVIAIPIQTLISVTSVIGLEARHKHAGSSFNIDNNRSSIEYGIRAILKPRLKSI